MHRAAWLFVRAALILAAFAGLGALAAYLGFDYLRDAEGPHKQDTHFYVAPGAQPLALSEALKAEGLIHDAAHYRWMHRWYQLPNTRAFMPKTGEFLIPAGASLDEIAVIFHKGAAVQRRITFPEGLTSAQMLQKIDEAVGLRGDLPVNIAEGSLFPDTYFYLYAMRKVDLVNRMQAQMEIELAQAWALRADGLPYQNAQDALILASIIEKETGISGERGLVASVFINRLRRGMRLQSDPTVVYGIGKTDIAGYVITKSDLKAENPYNTYRIKALPKGPITNPGRASIEAALNPSISDYLYFVADGKGGHLFAKTLSEHNNNVRKYREIKSKSNLNN